MADEFAVDGARGEALTRDIEARLRKSLHYVIGIVREPLAVDECASAAFLDAVDRTPRIAPHVHALYHALVKAYQDGAFDRAGALLRRLVNEAPAAGTHRIGAFDEATLGLGLPTIYAALCDIEEENKLDLAAPDPAEFAGFTAKADEAFRLMGRFDPELEREYRAYVRDLVVVGQGAARRFEAGAVSCFATWGAVFVVPGAQRDGLDLVQTLAHELTHQYLFARAVDGPLVHNPIRERYYSPLRDELRTMSGIFHATIVSARMVRANLKQAENPDPAMRALALARAAQSVPFFEAGAAELDKDGDLSPLGHAILDGARTFMANVPEPVRSVA